MGMPFLFAHHYRLFWPPAVLVQIDPVLLAVLVEYRLEVLPQTAVHLVWQHH